MGNIEHWTLHPSNLADDSDAPAGPGQERLIAVGPDVVDDVVEVVRASTYRGAVEALEKIAAVDYSEPGITPVVFRLRNVVATALAALDRPRGAVGP